MSTENTESTESTASAIIASGPKTRLGLEFREAAAGLLSERALRIKESMERARRVVGPRSLRLVVRTEIALEIESICDVSVDGRGLIDEWELVASPDAAADQMTLFDPTGLWVYSTFVAPGELSEEASRVYEGLRRAGYAIPKALELALTLGVALEVPPPAGPQPSARRAEQLYVAGNDDQVGGDDTDGDVTFLGER